MQSNTIYLIRHGAVDESCKGKYIGVTDVHLSENGKKQLKRWPLILFMGAQHTREIFRTIEGNPGKLIAVIIQKPWC